MADSNYFESFHLDTKNMDAIITQVQEIAKIMESTKENYRRQVTALTKNWTGRGRSMFDKKSAELIRTLTDVSQSFFDIGEDLLTASQTYMEADTENSKAADGILNRY